MNSSDVLTAAKYDWVQAAVNVVASGRELRMNSGKEQLIDLAAAKMKNASRTAANNMSVDLYSNGALANQMGGLANIIQTNGQGTVGGINSTTWNFWRNQFFEAPGTNTVTKLNIKGYMNTLYLNLARGSDRPDLIVSSHDFFSLFWEGLQDLQRYSRDSENAVAGFRSLQFVDADVIFDTNTNFATNAERMYFLNTDYLELVEHSAARWTTMDEKTSVNQDGVVIPMLWMGNLTCSNRALQGILIDAA